MSEVSLQAINLPGPGVRTQYQGAAARLFLEERTARIRRRLCCSRERHRKVSTSGIMNLLM